MKLRQKLAAAMAAAMVVTSVPVVTMAASTNTMSTSTVVVREDSIFTSSATAPALSIEFKNFRAGETFYLTLEGAEWNVNESGELIDGVGTYSVSGVTFTVIDDETLKVQVADTTGLVDSKKLEIPLLTKITEAQATVKLETKGSGSTITEGSWVYATTTDEVGVATVGSATTFSKEGKIAEITLKEAFKGSMNRTDGKNNYALIELNDSDFKFDMSEGIVGSGVSGFGLTKSGNDYTFTSGTGNYTQYKVLASYMYGFSGVGSNTITVYVSNDGTSMYVELPNESADSIGVIKLKDLHVKSNVKNPSAKELTVDISGNIEKVKNAVVAKLGSYGATIKVEESVDIYAGQTEEVVFELQEDVAGTLTKGRDIEFSVKNGYFVDAILDAKDKVDDAATEKALIEVISSIEYQVDGDKEKAFTSESDLASLITDVEVDEEDRVVGFTITPQVAYDTKDVNGFVITADLSVGLEQSGDITVEVASRDLEEKVSGTIGTAKAAYKVESEAAVLKTGLKDQKAGKITLSETNATLLEKGETLVVYLPDVKGITFSTDKNEKPEVKVTKGDLQVGEVKVTTATNSDGDKVPAVTIEVKRASEEASTIEISNLCIDTDGTVAQGSYDVEIGGVALTELNETLTVKDFIKVGAAGEDLGANGLAKGTSTFVIGESKYTVNGVEKIMDAQSYIQDPGYTMIPVRYVAEAFGVAGNDILFSNGTVTIFAGTRTIQLKNGSAVATVNGAQVTMGTKVVIKDGRTYAPVGEVARLLGVSTSWDNTTKTATFTNK